MVFRPPENKFFDFLNIMTAEVNTKQEETTVNLTVDKQHNSKRSFVSSIGGVSSAYKSTQVEIDDPLEMTAVKIERMLCKNMDCPAVKKFKDYGIGPLATGKGLGTLYGDVEPPITYGLSHTYGTMKSYGPYGAYTRPKRIDQPFIPSKNALETKLPPPERKCKCGDKNKGYRLGGGSVPKVKASKKHNRCVCVENQNLHFSPTMSGMRCSSTANHDKSISKRNVEIFYENMLRNKLKSNIFPPTNNSRNSSCLNQCGAISDIKQFRVDGDTNRILRLRGGGCGDLDDETSDPGPKSPFQECKPVMDQFDEILAAYKKALGPCGTTTCPYAGNLAEESCKQVCEQKNQQVVEKGSVSCKSIPCDMEDCVYRENKNKYPAGCGSVKCAYTKYKLGLIDDDAALELQFLPPAIAGKCGHPKCPYPLKPDLPPIHWDCPDPLPAKGACRNPNCPLQPPDLKKLKCPPRRGPCGNENCPYALPPPCELYTCTFRQRPCPFMENQNKENGDKSSEEGNICENPDCPFAKRSSTSASSESDPAIRGEFSACSNPSCPFANKKHTKNNKKNKPKKDGCGDPNCPAKEKLKAEDTCDNPKCPSRTIPKSEDKEMSDCPHPDCPFAVQRNRRVKNKNNKRRKSNNNSSSTKSSSYCDNPDCPYASIQNDEKCPEETADCYEGVTTCDNPKCPFTHKKEKLSSPCDDSDCPYYQPLPSCGVPNCPYERVPTVYCPSPNCPSKKQYRKETTRTSNGRSEIVSKDDDKTPCNIVVENEIVMCENNDCEGNKDRNGSGESNKVGGGGFGMDEAQQPGSENNKGGENETGGGGDAEGCTKKRRKRGRFVHTMGDRYPGVKVGHKECVTPVFNVPPKMGWLWNIFTPILSMKPRRGWKPGAIERTIAQRIRAHRQAQGLGFRRTPKFQDHEGRDDVDDDMIAVMPKPTLHIQKKEGAYWITMNPLKDPKTLAENEDPYMECTPMQFRITKNKKQKDDDNSICCCEDIDSSSSSESELDIEFTPPAGIIHPERFKKKKNVIHCDTQYDPVDFETKKPPKVEKNKKGKGGNDGKGKKGKKGKK